MNYKVKNEFLDNFDCFLKIYFDLHTIYIKIKNLSIFY